MRYANVAVSLFILCIPLSQAQDAFDELESSTKKLDERQSEDSGNGFKDFMRQQKREFEDYKEKVRKEFAAFKKAHDDATSEYKSRITEVWQEPVTSSRKRWVTYDDRYRLRTEIDFEGETLRIAWPQNSREELKREGARDRLEQLLELTSKEAFQQDEVAQKVEAFGKEKLSTFETAEVDETPLIEGFLLGSSNSDAETRAALLEHFMNNAERIELSESGQSVAAWEFPLEAPASMVQVANGTKSGADVTEKPADQVDDTPENVKSREDDKSGNGTSVAEKPADPAEPGNGDGGVWQTETISRDMVERLPNSAHGFVGAINEKNAEFKLSVELILALIETESAFNPMAKSHIPAYGLMQIVPKSAGMDATEKIFGKPRVLSPSYLYHSGNNIEIGAAYFNILYYRYFEAVENSRSRLYCAIAAYNTGPGNVAKALKRGGEMKLGPATREANSMSSKEVYERLINHLPYEETVHYLRKVTNRLKKYERLAANAE